MLTDYPKMPSVEQSSPEEYVVALYQAIGWDGSCDLDPKKIVLNTAQWEDIAGQFRQSPEGLSAAFAWMNWGPSADDHVPYGQVEIQDGAFQINEPELPTYYFSFGSSEKFPFQQGWVEVQAASVGEAAGLFRSHHPDRNPGILNCAFIYDEKQWRETPMAQGGPGQVCHQVIKEPGPHLLEKQERPLNDLMADAKEKAAEKNLARSERQLALKPHDLER